SPSSLSLFQHPAPPAISTLSLHDALPICKGLLDIYPKWREPLPFAYESTGTETQFTNQLDPSPKSRNVFAFHRPETLLEYLEPNANLNTRLTNLLTADQMPTTNLWSAQIEAIRNLEKSLAVNKRRALIQMATGSGKTYTRSDPSPKSRNVFAFHRPETLLEYLEPNANLNTRLTNLLTADQMPTTNLWSAQIEAIRNLEKSLAVNKRRALIQMATGSGKTYT